MSSRKYRPRRPFLRRTLMKLRPSVEAVEDRVMLASSLIGDLTINDRTLVAVLAANSGTFFAARNAEDRIDLFRTDGQGTSLLKTFRSLDSGRDFQGFGLTAVDEGVVFAADDGATGTEVWRSDGTPEGTVRLTDLVPGPGSAYPSAPFVVHDPLQGDRLSFWSRETVGGAQASRLWTIERSTSAPAPLATFPDRAGTNGVQGQIAAGADLYFVIATETHGSELWVSNGTEAGTSLVQDIHEGPSDGVSFPDPSDIRGYWASVGTTLYFRADDGATGPEVWATDRSLGITRRVADLNPGPSGGLSAPGGTALNPQMTAVGSALAFLGYEPDHGIELRSLGGINETPRIVYDLRLGQAGGFPVPDFAYASTDLGFVAVGSRVVFLGTPSGSGIGLYALDEGQVVPLSLAEPGGLARSAYRFTPAATQVYYLRNRDDGGTQLWRTDGTAEGTRLVLASPSGSNPFAGSSFVTVGDRLFFTYEDPVHGEEVWSTDGTPGSAAIVRDLLPGPRGSGVGRGGGPSTLHRGASGAVFAGRDGDGHAPARLWTSDGTEGGTVPLMTFAKSYSDGSTVEAAITVGDRVVGVGTFDGRKALFATDGTPGGTNLLGSPFGGGFAAGELVAFRGSAYLFLGDPAGLEAHLWKTDGTPAGTVRLATVPYRPDFPPPRLARLGDRLVFAVPGAASSQLWATDGTQAGTSAYATLPFGLETAPGGRIDLVEGPSRMAFTSLSGSQVWTSDGTAGGTALVRDLGASSVSSLTVLGSSLYFLTSGAENELWRSDGTAEGTQVVDQSGLGSRLALYGLTEGLGRLFLVADNGIDGLQLWTTDGTAEAIQPLASARPGSLVLQGVEPIAGLSLGGGFYYLADNGQGRDLWRTDGTPSGTRLVKTGAANLRVLGDRLFFSSSGSQSPFGLWQTDGTPSGTTAVSGVGSDTSAGSLALGLLSRGLLALGAVPGSGDELLLVTAPPPPGNTAPTLDPVAPFSAQLGTDITFRAQGFDPDAGQSLLYGLAADPSGVWPEGATIDAQTGAFFWRPVSEAQGGEFRLLVTVTDGVILQPVTTPVRITITPRPPANRPPVFNPIAPQNAKAGTPFTFTPTATDDQADPLVVTIVSGLPPGASFSENGTLTWTPSADQAGTVEVRLRVTDAGSPALFSEITVVIVVAPEVILPGGGGDPPPSPPVDTTPLQPSSLGDPSAQASRVISMRLVRRKAAVSAIVLTFDGKLDPASALDLRQYKLGNPGRDRLFGTRDDKLIRLRRAEYDDRARTVTLFLRARTAIRGAVQFQASGLQNALGQPIDGDRNGTAGGVFRTRVSSKGVSMLSLVQGERRPEVEIARRRPRARRHRPS